MSNSNALERWRPHPFVYLHCSVTIALLGGATSWAMSLLIARHHQPQDSVNAAIIGMGLFLALLWLCLRRCSTPELPGFRGLLLLTAYMTIGSGTFALLFVIPAVGFAIMAIIAIAIVSVFRDAAYAQNNFRKLLEFYRRHRMYQ
jgi:drug/metabolite transporter (DMT)-like permease